MPYVDIKLKKSRSLKTAVYNKIWHKTAPLILEAVQIFSKIPALKG